MSRALFYAGAAGLVLSLWRVQDEPTRDLTAAFYEGLRAGLHPAEALRLACLEVRGGYPEPWGPHPLTNQ